MSATTMTQCLECGFEAPSGADVWDSVQHPPLGEMTQCPECGSTDTRHL